MQHMRGLGINNVVNKIQTVLLTYLSDCNFLHDVISYSPSANKVDEFIV